MMTKWMALLLAAGVMSVPAADTGGWSEPVEVRHQETLALTYRARLAGPDLIVRAAIEPGWHTFSMDNKLRAEEKLAGKKALSVDQPTEFVLTGAQVDGKWMQTAPKDFSKPELRMFSWGYEREAVFTAKVRRAGSAPVKIAVRAQACTDTICRNIDTVIDVPAGKGKAGPEVSLKGLVAVR